MTLPLLLLDLDGTLTDSAPVIRRLARATLLEMGLSDPGEDGLADFVGPGLWHGFAGLGMAPERIDEAITLYRGRYVAEGIAATRAFPGIATALGWLRATGLTMAVATSKPEAYAVQVVEHTGLHRAVEHVYGAPSDDPSSTKGSVIAHALTSLGPGLVPEKRRILMVGDRSHDVVGAAQHGIACLGVGWGEARPGELVGAIGVVDDVDHLADAVLAYLHSR